jgi:hypothetical protein
MFRFLAKILLLKQIWNFFRSFRSRRRGERVY